MTYKDLTKELGVNGFKLAAIEKTGLLKNRGAAALIGNIDESDVDVIRKYCLFSMLGITDAETTSLLKGETDFRAVLKEHVEQILADDSNPSQAAIVLQGIRRECSDINELDTKGFLLQIKELKASGGLFYDVNTGSLEKRRSTQNGFSDTKQKNRTQGFGLFGFKPKDDPAYDEDRWQDREEKAGEESRETENGDEAFEAEAGEDYSGQETGNPRNTAYDEKWSPYTNRGFGASNMGTGNWHGWTPGYGTYSKTVGARERVNNGEKTCPHPLRRFAARVLDTTLITIIAGAVMRIAFRINIGKDIKMMAYCEIIFWLFEMMIEPILLSTIGTTPGKYLMGVKVRDMKTKGKLEIKQAYIRTLKLAWHGFGFMIPIYTLFKRAMSYMRCKVNDTMPWDNGIDVELSDEAPFRLILCLIAIILLNIGDEIVSKQALIPQNRGDITKEQFYENVAELIKYTGYSREMPDFIIETQNGFVKSVSLKYSADENDANRYDEIYLGFLAFAGASDSSNGLDLMFGSALKRLKSYYVNFQEEYCGIKIVNESDSGITSESSYNQLFNLLYGTDISVTNFNQTFTMTK